MKVRIMGTAAYERVPAMFCKCGVCEQARRLGGRNIRTQTQTLINDDLLIDFGQDTYIHYLNGRFDFTKIKNILLTHAHPDHFMPNELEMTGGWFCKNDVVEPIELWGNATCCEKYAAEANVANCRFNTIEAFQVIHPGEYTVTALPASHGKNDPLLYIITDGTKTLLYNLDSGFWKDEVYEYVLNNHLRFDYVICDGTFCFQKDKTGISHMSLENNVAFRTRLNDIGAIRKDTPWIVTHFSHNGLLLNDKPVSAEEMERIFATHGMAVAYDGVEITI